MKSPITDTTLGIKLGNDDKFRDVRKKAHDEYIERHKKRKKDPVIIAPAYKEGDVVVMVDGYCDKKYFMIEIVDMFSRDKEYSYFGIILKTTDKNAISRIGRIIMTGGNGGYYMFPRIENIPPDSIKWLDEKGE